MLRPRLSKWSSHNEYSHNAINNHVLAWKHGHGQRKQQIDYFPALSVVIKTKQIDSSNLVIGILFSCLETKNNKWTHQTLYMDHIQMFWHQKQDMHELNFVKVNTNLLK